MDFCGGAERPPMTKVIEDERYTAVLMSDSIPGIFSVSAVYNRMISLCGIYIDFFMSEKIDLGNYKFYRWLTTC